MSMDYTEYVNSLTTMLVIRDASGVANLNEILPRGIEYAELRIYREFDFLATRTQDTTQLTTPGDRTVPVPSRFIVLEGASIITPVNTLPDQSGAQRIPMLRVSRAYIDMTWPVATLTQAPQPFETYYSLFSDEESSSEGASSIPNVIRIAPTPDGEYYVEYTGTFRPEPLSDSNPNTLLTEFFPDLFLAASMIFFSGYQRNFGAQAEDPKMAVSWEQQYNILKMGVDVEESRKKMFGADASPFGPQPLLGVERSGRSKNGGDG